LFVNAAAHPPEVPDRFDIVAARHDPFIGVGQKGFHIHDAAFGKGFFDQGIGHVFGGAGGNRGFDEHQAVGPDMGADHLEAVFQGRDLHIALPDIAQAVLEVVALHIHHHDVCQAQGFIGKAGRQGLFFQHAPGDQRGHFRSSASTGARPRFSIGILH
jgi:hypothetical protein